MPHLNKRLSFHTPIQNKLLEILNSNTNKFLVKSRKKDAKCSIYKLDKIFSNLFSLVLVQGKDK